MRDRRDFIRTTAGTLACLLSNRGLSAWEIGREIAAPGPPVKLAVVGLGSWGREILTALARVPAADVAMVCDVYAPAVRRAGEIVPGAAGVADLRRALDSPAIEAIVVATPTPAHAAIRWRRRSTTPVRSPVPRSRTPLTSCREGCRGDRTSCTGTSPGS
jgi:hypothetical protein